MKRMIVFLLSLLMITSLVACGSQQPEESMPPDYCDDDFLSDLQAGLMERWDLTEEENGETDKSERELRTGYINAELNKIEQYRTGLFENSKLQEQAIAYINLLHDQLDSLDLFNADFEQYRKLWGEAYDKRTQMVSAFINDYNLEFPEKYTEVVKDFLTNAKVVTDKNELDQQIQQMINALNFELIENDYGLKTYRATIENITSKTFSTLDIAVKLLDSENVIIETTAVFVDQLAPGQKAYLDFMTDKDFATYETALSFYDTTD